MLVKKEDAIRIITKHLTKAFEDGTHQSPYDANNSEYWLPHLNLKVAPEIYKELTRGTEDRQDKHPTLANLRESGAIEQDAKE